MMSKKFTKKILIGTLLFSFGFINLFWPFSVALSAGPYEPEDIDLSSYYNLGNGSSGKKNTPGNDDLSSNPNAYNLNIQNIGDIMPAVVGCTGIVNKVEKQLNSFLNPSGIENNFKDPKTGGVSGTGAAKPIEYYDTDGNLVPGDGASGADFPNAQLVPTSEASAQAIKKAAEDQKKIEEQEKLREECINGIAYSLAKKQLEKITDVTVNWINSGFNGDPLYIRDRESYFKSLAEGNLTSLVGPIADVNNRLIYPFGRDVARTIINSQKSNYESRARSTLQNSLREGATIEDFENDFGAGGWDGWFSLTQNDQNNPLGFSIMTSQELSDKITRDQENARAELLEGRGFLSQKRCVEYAGESKEDTRFKKGTLGNTEEGDMEKCLKWETATPGSIIADQASTALTSHIRQGELADSLNESLSRIGEALVNQMMRQGLSSLNSFVSKFDRTLGGPGSNKIYDSAGNDITGLGSSSAGGSVLSVNKGRGWYSKDGDFDITTDLGDVRKRGADGKIYVVRKGIISIQKDYAESAKQSLAKLPPIMPALGELDYCIPGPTPNWEVYAKDSINAKIEYLQSLYFSNGLVYVGKTDPFIENFHKTQNILTLGMHSQTTGLITQAESLFADLTGGKSAEEYKKSLQDQFEQRIAAKEATFEEKRREAIIAEKESFAWYKDRMDRLYGEGSPMRTPGSPWHIPMAESGIEATKYIVNYDESIRDATRDYKDLINQTNSNIYKLEVIKKEVDAILRAARKRRAEEMDRRGLPAIDPSCYDLQPADLPNGGGVLGPASGKPTGGGLGFGPAGGTGGTSTTPGGAGTNPSTPSSTTSASSGAGAVASPTPNFEITTKENKNACEIAITGKDKSTGYITSYAWGLKLDGQSGIIASGTNKDFGATLATNTQYGKATLTLTLKDINGSPVSLSKSLTIKKSTLGTKCPQ